jgi:carboxylesterase type B
MKYSDAKAWLYELNHTAFTAMYALAGTPYLVVSHVSDIPYVFNNVAAFNGTSLDSLLAAQMSGNWSAFATDGMPAKTTWPIAYPAVDFIPPANPREAVVNVIGGPSAGPARIGIGNCEGPAAMEQLLVRCAFWSGAYDQLQN